MKSKCPSSQKLGFTLVELLVVIGIIALLISILLPALNKAREQANAAKCAANMRSAVQALMIYTAENKGWLPGPSTSGAIWKSGIDAIGPAETSSDETPLQNFDWVSPTYGKTMRWSENDYQRLKTTFNDQLSCPSNGVFFQEMSYNDENLPAGDQRDLKYSSYSAVIQFHANPGREKIAALKLAPISGDMFTNGSLTAPASYAPQMSKIGPAASKVYLVEGSRYIELSAPNTWDAGALKVSFNATRYQRVGGNYMIGGPFEPWPNTPYQLFGGSVSTYNGKRMTPVSKTYAWRHNGKMNLAFFDGHVEMRGIADSTQVSLYVPKGTTIVTAADTYDPNDKDNQIVP